MMEIIERNFILSEISRELPYKLFVRLRKDAARWIPATDNVVHLVATVMHVPDFIKMREHQIWKSCDLENFKFCQLSSTLHKL